MVRENGFRQPAGWAFVLDESTAVTYQKHTGFRKLGQLIKFYSLIRLKS